MNSSPVICAIESSSSNASIQSELALGGQNMLQIKSGLAFSKETSVHKVLIFEISMSHLRLKFHKGQEYEECFPLTLIYEFHRF